MALSEDHGKEDVIQWHRLEVYEVLERLGTAQHRELALEEARRRLAHYGSNRLPPPRKHPAWLRFLLQFHNVLIYMILVAAGIAALALFLASDAAKSISGQILPIDNDMPQAS